MIVKSQDFKEIGFGSPSTSWCGCCCHRGLSRGRVSGHEEMVYLVSGGLGPKKAIAESPTSEPFLPAGRRESTRVAKARTRRRLSTIYKCSSLQNHGERLNVSRDLRRQRWEAGLAKHNERTRKHVILFGHDDDVDFVLSSE